ncbi:MAG: hypothetical protein Q7R39_14900 [Dehalococcoidia bacterium]|nr:hypothetical protein [Dehalococcoidia bacterium]
MQRSAAPKSRTLDEVMQALEESLPQEIRQRMEALLGAIAVGDPPILLELTDTKKLEELTRLLVATFLSVAGVQVISPDVERHKGVRRVAETRTYKAG